MYYPTERFSLYNIVYYFLILKAFQVQIKRWTQSKGFHFGDLTVFGVCRIGVVWHRTILSLSVCSDSLSSGPVPVSRPFYFTPHFLLGNSSLPTINSTSVFCSQSSDSRVPRLVAAAQMESTKLCPVSSLPQTTSSLAFSYFVNGPPSPLCLKAIIFDPFPLHILPIQSFPKSFLVYSVKCLYVFKLFLESFVHVKTCTVWRPLDSASLLFIPVAALEAKLVGQYISINLITKNLILT